MSRPLPATFRSGLATAVPIAMGYFPIAFAFGVAAIVLLLLVGAHLLLFGWLVLVTLSNERGRQRLLQLLLAIAAARALHQFGWHDDTRDAALVERAKRRLLFGVAGDGVHSSRVQATCDT